MLKIKCGSTENFSSALALLRAHGVEIRVVNPQRLTIAVDELSSAVLSTLQELGTNIMADVQYDSDISE